MFKQKKCPNCREKIKTNFSFCPQCGKPLKNKKQNYGMLGKTDLQMNNQFNELQIPRGVNILFNSLVKNFEKQLNEIEKANLVQDKNAIQQGGIKISISTSGNKPQIKFQNLNEKKKKVHQTKKIPKKTLQISQDKLTKLQSLPREEPKTNIRRFSDKVIYEIEMPGVKSLEDISIIQLENSIEIKALANKKSYEKIINLNLPISEYSLSKGKLILELAEED